MSSRSPTFECRSSLRNKTPKMDYKNNLEHMYVTNNNITMGSPKRTQIFAQWYKDLMDNDRNKLGLYLADNAVLKWFGRTIQQKKNITGFINVDMNCTNHIFSSVRPCDPISLNTNLESSARRRLQMEDDSTEELATPLCGDTPTRVFNSFSQVSLRSLSNKRPRSKSSSPELESPVNTNALKRLKTRKLAMMEINANPKNGKTSSFGNKMASDTDNDCDSSSPSTSANNTPIKNREVPNLPHYFVEAVCILEFTKVRNSRAGMYKWERQCKLQIEYTDDPACVGDYIIWKIVYNDNNKCRRNLLAAFNAAS